MHVIVEETLLDTTSLAQWPKTTFYLLVSAIFLLLVNTYENETKTFLLMIKQHAKLEFAEKQHIETPCNYIPHDQQLEFIIQTVKGHP